MTTDQDLLADRTDRISAVDFDYDVQPKSCARCNLCGGEHGWGIAWRDRFGFPATYWLCRGCGLVYARSPMTAAAFDEFYWSGTYRRLVEAFTGQMQTVAEMEAGQMDYGRFVKSHFAEYAAPGSESGRLLDIGGSTGATIEAAAFPEEWRITVLDPAEDELKHAKRRGFETVCGTLDDFGTSPMGFNLITMFQTIDHILDVTGALAKIRDMLTAGGLFLFDIVEFRVLVASMKSVEQAVKIDHPFGLTIPTIKAYLARAGFKEVKRVSTPDYRKTFFLCEACEPRPDALPSCSSVGEMFDLAVMYGTAVKRSEF